MFLYFLLSLLGFGLLTFSFFQVLPKEYATNTATYAASFIVVIVSLICGKIILSSRYPSKLVIPLNKTAPEFEIHVIDRSIRQYFLRNQNNDYDLSSFEEFATAIEVFEQKQFYPAELSNSFFRELNKIKGFITSNFFGINIFTALLILAIGVLALVYFEGSLSIFISLIVGAGFLLSFYYFYQGTLNSLFGFRIENDEITTYGLLGVKRHKVSEIYYFDEKTFRNQLLPPIGAYPHAIQIKNKKGELIFHFLKASVPLELEMLLRNNCHIYPRER